MNIAPKNNFIDSTRSLINSPEGRKKIPVGEIEITTDPEVFDPEIFFSSQWFAKEVAELTKDDKILIEVGCGTGIVSINSAKENRNLIVHATDINEKAKEVTEENARANEVGERVFVYSGDVLDAIPKEVKADSIFWAMPFGYLDPKDELKGRDTQVFDPGYRAIRKFFAEAKDHLNENGKLFVGFSIDIGHFKLLEEIAKENNFELKKILQTKGVEKEAVSMEIYEARLIQQ